jgi:Lon protease-like protein
MLPLFPLQLVVYPTEQLNLHIFEPRYRQLIHECEETGINFGIPAYIDESVSETGTEMELLRIEKRYPDGKMDVVTRGTGLFRIERFYRQAPGKLYAGAEVQPLPYRLDDGDPARAQELLEQVGELYRLLGVDRQAPTELSTFSTYAVAHHVGFSLKQQYELLTLPGEGQRQAYMLEHLKEFLPQVRHMHEVRQRIQMNGHFRNIKPPNI